MNDGVQRQPIDRPRTDCAGYIVHLEDGDESKDIVGELEAAVGRMNEIVGFLSTTIRYCTSHRATVLLVVERGTDEVEVISEEGQQKVVKSLLQRKLYDEEEDGDEEDDDWVW